MFRLTQIMRRLSKPAGGERPPSRAFQGPVVVWNLIRRCNLTCRHCYSASSDRDFQGELDTGEVFRVLAELKECRVPALILSGGEPLLRPDLFKIAERAKELGFYLGLSSNGTLMDDSMAERIAAARFNYVGVSLDGLAENHDRIRGKAGAFVESIAGIRNCNARGVKAGIRFTPTRENADDLPRLLDRMPEEGIDRFYLSHWNYAGRGQANRAEDAAHRLTRRIMNHLFDTAWNDIQSDNGREIVTGNNDADGVFFLQWVAGNQPEWLPRAQNMLQRWGGNASGVGIANIDNRGHVHPDIFWWQHDLGDLRQRSFQEIWHDNADPLLAGLRQRPRPVKGRCGACQHLTICGGNTRVRALQSTGDPWAEDPGCYLTDAEIGLESGEPS